MSLSFWLVFSLFLVNNIGLLIVTSVNLRFKYSASYWRKCDIGNDEFLMIRNIPIQKCIFECRVRGRCHAVKFITIRHECGLLEKPVNMATEYNTGPCVFMQMADVTDDISFPDICKSCSSNQVCNIRKKKCVIKECERLSVPHADVLGNMQSIGAKVKIVPHTAYTLEQYNGATRCNSSGEWDNVPKIVEKCELDWIIIEQSCYHLSLDKKTADEAEAYCSAKSAHLVYIETEKENANIEHFLNNKVAWIGITDADSEGVWTFINTTLNATFTSWALHQPDNNGGNEHCADIGRFATGWNDLPCSAKVAVICEKSPKMTEA